MDKLNRQQAGSYNTETRTNRSQHFSHAVIKIFPGIKLPKAAPLN
jgi:hypothetical protein